MTLHAVVGVSFAVLSAVLHYHFPLWCSEMSSLGGVLLPTVDWEEEATWDHLEKWAIAEVVKRCFGFSAASTVDWSEGKVGEMVLYYQHSQPHYFLFFE